MRILVGNLAGSGMDVAARAVGQRLSQNLGVQFIVDNRAGAGGLIAAEVLAKSPADGYTLLLVNAGFTTLPLLHPKSDIDIKKDFAAVTLLAEASNILTTHAAVPARSVKELLALAKAKPGVLTIGTLPPGGFTHLCTVLFEMLSGVRLSPVLYKGAPAAVTDLVAGQIDLTFSSVSPVISFIKSGRLRGLAVTTINRSSIVPDVPTLGESGVSGYDASLWFALLAPSATPLDVIGKIQQEASKALSASEVRTTFIANGLEPKSSSSSEINARIESESVKWREVLKAAK